MHTTDKIIGLSIIYSIPTNKLPDTQSAPNNVSFEVQKKTLKL